MLPLGKCFPKKTGIDRGGKIGRNGRYPGWSPGAVRRPDLFLFEHLGSECMSNLWLILAPLILVVALILFFRLTKKS